MSSKKQAIDQQCAHYVRGWLEGVIQTMVRRNQMRPAVANLVREELDKMARSGLFEGLRDTLNEHAERLGEICQPDPKTGEAPADGYQI